MAYPSSIDNGTTLPYPSATGDTNSPSLSSGQSVQNNAIIAVETLVGTNSSQTAPVANTVLTSPANGSNEWQQITSAFVSSATGSGEFVFATSPTLTSPTLNSPTISSPSITGSLGNISTGTITASGAITANGGLTVSSSFTATGLVNYADLLSTIFSGEVNSYTNSGTGGGTFYYLNLGGIKLLWGMSSLNTSAPTIVYPVGFFNSVTMATYSLMNVSAAPSGIVFWTDGLNTTSLVINNTGGPSGMNFDMSVLVIGT